MKIRALQTGLVDATFSLAGLASLGFGLYFMANKELSLAVTALGAGLVHRMLFIGSCCCIAV